MIKKYFNKFKNKVKYNNYIVKEIQQRKNKKDKKIFWFFNFFYSFLTFSIVYSFFGLFLTTILPEITFFQQHTKKENTFYINEYFNQNTNIYSLKNKINIKEINIDDNFLNEYYDYQLKKHNADIDNKVQNNIKFDTFSYYLQEDYIIEEMSFDKFKEKFYKDNQLYSSYFNFYSWNNDTYFLTNKKGNIIIYNSKNKENHNLKKYNNNSYNVSFDEKINMYTIRENNDNNLLYQFSIFSTYIQDKSDFLNNFDISLTATIKNNDNNNFSFSYINNNESFKTYFYFNDKLNQAIEQHIKELKEIKKSSINTFLITLIIFLISFPFFRKLNKRIKNKNNKIKNEITKDWLLKYNNQLLLEYKPSKNIQNSSNKNHKILF
tara:strand:- start:4009 stop:5142 length:1134 start_codon:yes stop_codon:yes gene_type:complete